MLVLSRKKNESIIIDLGNGKTINLMVVEIRGDKVRLGIDAPKEVPINRAEVVNKIRAKQEIVKQ